MGKPKLEDNKSTSFKDATKKRPALKEFQEKKCPFPISDLLGMQDDLLKKRITELPEPKRPEETGSTTDPKYCWYHRVISHSLEKCITLKVCIVQLTRNGMIILDLDEQQKLIIHLSYVSIMVHCVKRVNHLAALEKYN